MKKFILTAAMGVLFFVGLTSMMSTPPPPPPFDFKEECAILIALGYFPNQGACVSTIATCGNPGQGEGKQAVCICNIIDALFGLENEGINFGQCVTIIKAGGGGDGPIR